MKGFFTEWWDIQEEEKAMEKAYMKKHGKGVAIMNAVLIAVPIAGMAIYGKVKNKDKKKEQISEGEES
jgi:hypothetical protein